MNIIKDEIPVALIIGKNGQVGYELCRSLSYFTKVTAIDYPDIDLNSRASILEQLERFRPRVIANAAAYTAVDKAESEPAVAEAINAKAPAVMAEWAAENGAVMLHYSTDYVFNGTKESPWTEDDVPDPLNVYGVTKLAGDRAIDEAGCNYMIFRTSWVYGARGKNFYLNMRKLLCEKEELRVIDDQFGAPTWSRTLADIPALALRTLLGTDDERAKELSGIYNLTNAGETTWFGFTQLIRRQLEAENPSVKLARLVPITTEEYPTAAQRPKHSALSGTKLAAVFGLRAQNWDAAAEMARNG